MSRGPSNFKKSDLTRATRAVIAAGLDVLRIDVNKNGGFTIVPRKSTDKAAALSEPEDLRELL